MSDARTPPTRRLHVLVVVDDEDHADLLLGMLREHPAGHTADHVTDGQAALDYLDAIKLQPRSRWPSVILLDIKLPRVDGLQVLERIKGDALLGSIPIVVLTTSAQQADRERAYFLHANSYIVKPVNYGKFEILVGDLSTYWGAWDCGTR